MEFAFTVGVIGWLVLILGAIVIGIVAQLIGQPEFGYEWVVTAIGAFIGGVAASEFVVGLQTFEPVYDGLALIPALIGGLVVGTVVAVATRLLTGGSYRGEATA